MSLASDARYRSIRVSFLNNEQDGSEFVQLLAKPSGGTWAAQRTFPVALTGDQEMQWEAALPLYLYNLALRYMIGSVAAVGYESTDPDVWTASTAAGSKGTVTTSCAPVTGLAGSDFVNAATPITLTWACANQAVPFLIEKNIGAGWVTVVADLVATSYQYTIPAAELDTTVQFRVTPKRGTVAGTVSSTISVLMTLVVGATTWVSGTFSPATGLASLVWNAATRATSYLLEKSTNGGGSWSTVATVSATSYSYATLSGEANTTVKFRLTGKNGAVSGATSANQDVAMTVTVPVATLTAFTFAYGGPGAFHWTWDVSLGAGSAAFVGIWVELSLDGITFSPSPLLAASTAPDVPPTALTIVTVGPDIAFEPPKTIYGRVRPAISYGGLAWDGYTVFGAYSNIRSTLVLPP